MGRMTCALVALAIAVQKPAVKPQPLTPALKAKVIKQIGVILATKAFVPGKDFSTWPEVAIRHRKPLDAAKTPLAFATELYKALSEFGVSHLIAMPPGMGIDEKVKTFGFVVTRYKDEIVVTHVYAGTQAEKAGLKPGKVLSSYWYPDYPKTERVTVGYFDADHLEHTSTLTTENFVPSEKPDLLWFNKDAYVLRIPTFGTGYDSKLVEQLVHTAQKVPYLLIDLRGNGGGSPTAVDHLLGAFVPGGTRIGAAVSKEILRDFVKETKKSPSDRAAVVAWAPKSYAEIVADVKEKYNGRIAVLIDGECASGAEVAAQAFRDFAKAPIFGRRTSGQVLFMNWTDLPGGFSLYFPWRDHWTASGRRLEGNPVVPDVEVPEGSPEASPLPIPLRKVAMEWLRSHPAP